MKKIITCLLSLVIVLSIVLLTGCKNKINKDNNISPQIEQPVVEPSEPHNNWGVIAD